MNLTNQRKLSNSEYKAEIKFLSFMTALCGAGCILFGYFIVSLAAGFYAALLIAERRGRRIFSYLIPLVLFSVNILLNSVYSLGGISYVLLGLIIYFGYTNGKRKSEVVCYGIIAVLALMIFSFALIALYNLNSFNFLLVDDFYIDLYEKGKTLLIEHLTSFTRIDEQGFTYKMYNSGEAVGIYNAIVLSMIPAILIFSFVQVGIAVKIFTSRIRKLDPEDKKLSSWRFSTTPVISYFYLIVSFFSIFSKEGIVGLSLSFVAILLMAVYFYFGFCALFSFFASKKGTAFAVLVLGLGIILLPSFIPLIISYIGVFINNTIYKNEEKLS
jgi:hypothetical protein